MDNLKQKAISGFIWRIIQNGGSQAIGFAISIILARMLTPNDYGLIAMITIFTSIAMVFINVGFSSSIIQKQELDKVDINTLFYCGMCLAVAIYFILFCSAPWIASFYCEPELVALLRVQGVVVIIGGIYSVQQALIVRNLEFKKSCLANMAGVVIQGVVGITMAYLNFGAWALVFSSLSNSLVCAIIMWSVVEWKPSVCFSMESLISMVGFSTKMLLGELTNSAFNSIQAIIIGKQYSAADLAYYNRGWNIPALLMCHIDGAMSTVLFSTLSSIQGDWRGRGLPALRRSMRLSLYVCSPLMLGLFVVAKPLVLVLLTAKWADSIIFLQLVCIICLFWPLSAQRNALNARGYSGVSLILNIFSKTITIALILVTFRYSIVLMVVSSIVSSLVGFIVGMFVYRKYLEYPISAQIKDIAPPILLSIIMACCISSVSQLEFSNLLTLVAQLLLGIIVYVLLSYITKIDSFIYMLDIFKDIIKRKFGLDIEFSRIKRMGK